MARSASRIHAGPRPMSLRVRIFRPSIDVALRAQTKRNQSGRNFPLSAQAARVFTTCQFAQLTSAIKHLQAGVCVHVAPATLFCYLARHSVSGSRPGGSREPTTCPALLILIQRAAQGSPTKQRAPAPDGSHEAEQHNESRTSHVEPVETAPPDLEKVKISLTPDAWGRHRTAGLRGSGGH